MPNRLVNLIFLAIFLAPTQVLADGGATIKKKREIEGRLIDRECHKASDFHLCLVENGFKCELVVDAGNESYFCGKDAPPGHFEILWSRADAGWDEQIRWIDDRPGYHKY